MPRVSIVIPTYNRADLLPFTLKSALEQTFADREIMVIDNASTDETPQLMAQYAGAVRYIRKPVNKGLVDSVNQPANSFSCWILTTPFTRPRWRSR